MSIHCCDTMDRMIDPNCDRHTDPRDCEDAFVQYGPRFDRYALYARFGAAWVSRIAFCPWCGDAKRDLSDAWFDRMDALGHDWAKEEEMAGMPEAMRDDRWWKEVGL